MFFEYNLSHRYRYILFKLLMRRSDFYIMRVIFSYPSFSFISYSLLPSISHFPFFFIFLFSNNQTRKMKLPLLQWSIKMNNMIIFTWTKKDIESRTDIYLGAFLPVIHHKTHKLITKGNSRQTNHQDKLIILSRKELNSQHQTRKAKSQTGPV